MSRAALALLLAGLLPLLPGSPPPATAAGSPDAGVRAFKIRVVSPAVYRVGWEELREAGLEGEAESAALALTHRGEPVPIWVEDGGDGRLGAGDWLEFVGEALRGEHSWFDEYSAENVYRLSLDGGEPLRMGSRGAEPPAAGEVGAPARYRVRRHLEEDRLMLRFAPRGERQQELWYWAKVSHRDRQPLRVPVDLSGLDREGGGHVRLRVALRGWSMPRRKADPSNPDHRAIVFLDNSRVGTAEWNGQDEAIVEAEVPAAEVLGEEAWLSLRVPLRTVARAGGAEPLIDIAVLNWVEVDYPRTPRVAARQARLVPEAATDGAPLRLLTPAERSLVVYGDDGTRLDGSAMRTKVRASGEALHLFRPPAPGGPFHAVAGGELARPRAVEPDFPSRLRDPANRADYVMVTHRRLRPAVEPLAELHRDRGLAVAVVDVEDVYDEFNHGILHPRAIRDFLALARDRWRAPAPRWVLLVGDASWDVRNPTVDERNYVSWTFRENLPEPFPITAGTPYEERAHLNDRNLIPTWNYLTAQGHAASDNYFVTRPGGEDELPEMAIGRFPVTEPEEVAAIVEKTIRYLGGVEVGPWRRSVLWISDGAARMSRFTESVSRRAARRGLAAERIEPRPDDPTNEGHTRRLREALDRGQLLVHFFGHGGRFIWRTAPADLKKNRDLFGLEDLDLLEPNERLPVVLSMTCYSAPFDHPSSDSIGEKFLRLDGRGAVAVIAASWRNAPSEKVSDALVEELLTAPTVGEALANAKRRNARHRYFVHLYNLLGDPALELAAPPPGLALELVDRGEGRVRAALTDAGPGGRAVVEWLGEEGEVLAAEERALEAGTGPVELAYRGSRAAELLRVYVWNEEAGEDALGLLELGRPARAEAAAEERPAAGSRR